MHFVENVKSKPQLESHIHKWLQLSSLQQLSSRQNRATANVSANASAKVRLSELYLKTTVLLSARLTASEDFDVSTVSAFPAQPAQGS
jgi:hypothetical protein